MSDNEDLVGEEDNEDNDEISNDLKENLIKYVKVNDLIRDKQKEIKELRQEKTRFSEVIINFLTKIKEKTINVGNSKISKVESNVKQTLTNDIVKTAIGKCLMEDKLITDKSKIDEFIEKTFKMAETLREIKKNINLRCITKKNI